MIERNAIAPSIRFLSDPDLKLHARLGIPTSSGHPKARHYPAKAFLQPAAFLWDASGAERFAWRMKPRLLNLWGAVRRITPSELLSELVKVTPAASES